MALREQKSVAIVTAAYALGDGLSPGAKHEIERDYERKRGDCIGVQHCTAGEE